MKSKLLLYLSLSGVLALIVAAWLIAGGTVTKTSGTHLLMGTTVRITAVADKEETSTEAINNAVKTIKAVEQQLSIYEPNSELSRLNENAYHEAVKVSKPLFYLLSESKKLYELSGGAFDCTIAPVLELWRSSAESDTTPTNQQLQEAAVKTGSDKLILNEADRTVRFNVKGMKIDLGAIAKGYAIDKAVETMRDKGAAGGLVDIGGDIRCFGKTPKGRDRWTIGLQNPDLGEANQIIMRFALNDAALATSGGYYRFVEIKGKKISHIINPKTLTSTDELKSVSVIARQAITADALATSVSVLGADEGKTLIESIEDAQALMLSGDNRTIKTSGLSRYISED